MKRLLIAAATLVALLVTTTTTEAQSRYRQHNNAQYRTHTPHQRIQQGMRHGQLTPWEARQLRHKQRDLRHYRMMARRDGYVSPGERYTMQRKQQQLNRSIYRQRHNGYNAYR